MGSQQASEYLISGTTTSGSAVFEVIEPGEYVFILRFCQIVMNSEILVFTKCFLEPKTTALGLADA